MSEGVILIKILIYVVVAVEREPIGAAVATVGTKKHVEGVGATKERGKGGMGVSVEGVVVCCAARSTRRTAASCLQTCKRKGDSI